MDNITRWMGELDACLVGKEDRVYRRQRKIPSPALSMTE